jgi:predicted dehydrogenase
MDVGCHVLDRLDYLCGPLITIKGKAENRHSPGQLVEDYIQLTGKIGPSRSSSKDMIIREGADFECTWDFASPDKQPVDSLIFEGPTGSLRMTGMSPSAPIEILNSSGKLVKTLEFEMPDHTAQKLIQATTNDLLLARKKSSESKPEQPDFLSLGDNAIRTQEVLDKVLNDYYGGRETGYWSRMKN